MKAKSQTKQSRWVAGSLIVATAAVMLVLLWFYNWAPPSKADFKNAEQQTALLMEQMMVADTAANTYTEAVASSLRYEPTGTSVNTDTQKEQADFTAAMNGYKKQLVHLERSPAARDKDVASMVEQLSHDTTRFRGFLNAFTADYSTYYKSELGCDQLNRFKESKTAEATASEYARASKDCLSSLDALSKAKVGVLREYAVSRIANIKATSKAYTELVQAKTKRGSVQAELNKLKAQASAFNPLVDVRKTHDEIMNHELFDSLTDLLKKKQQS